MPPAAIMGGAMVGSALISSNAAKKAAKAQTSAADAAAAEQGRQFDISRADQMPWLQEGQGAIRTIGDLLRSGSIFPNFTGEDLASEPGYQFGLQEGNKAIENAARARGMFMSPSTVKGLLRYGNDYAGTKFQDAYNRDMTNRTTKYNMLSGVAGTGQTAANTLTSAGQNYANNVGQLVTGAANARGAAGIAGANAWGNALGQGANMYNQNSMLDRILNRGGYGGTSSTPYAGGYGWGST